MQLVYPTADDAGLFFPVKCSPERVSYSIARYWSARPLCIGRYTAVAASVHQEHTQHTAQRPVRHRAQLVGHLVQAGSLQTMMRSLQDQACFRQHAAVLPLEADVCLEPVQSSLPAAHTGAGIASQSSQRPVSLAACKAACLRAAGFSGPRLHELMAVKPGSAAVQITSQVKCLADDVDSEVASGCLMRHCLSNGQQGAVAISAAPIGAAMVPPGSGPHTVHRQSTEICEFLRCRLLRCAAAPISGSGRGAHNVSTRDAPIHGKRRRSDDDLQYVPYGKRARMEDATSSDASDASEVLPRRVPGRTKRVVPTPGPDADPASPRRRGRLKKVAPPPDADAGAAPPRRPGRPKKVVPPLDPNAKPSPRRKLGGHKKPVPSPALAIGSVGPPEEYIDGFHRKSLENSDRPEARIHRLLSSVSPSLYACLPKCRRHWVPVNWSSLAAAFDTGLMRSVPAACL